MVFFKLPNTYMVLVYGDPVHLHRQLAGLIKHVCLADRKVICCIPEPLSRALAGEFGEIVNRRLFFLVLEEYRVWYAGEPYLVRRNAEAIARGALAEGRTGAALVEVEYPPGERGPYGLSWPVREKVIQAIAGLPLSVFCFRPAGVPPATDKGTDGLPGAHGPGDTLNRAGLILDRASGLVKVYGRPVKLSPMESRLLWFLASHPGRVFSRRELLQAVWGYSYGDQTVAAHIHHLRRKIEPDPARPVFIKTVRGVGYRFTP
ncbi:MAG: winged helix-turn-helix domain-containing protein [Thermoanaerobacterales bacterium]|nr:winged helix-turn-helix domain-containing protein [Thermoanaerobacterales bacterium]